MFESKPDPQLEELKKLLTEMISLQGALLRKLETQNTTLSAIAKFVTDNSEKRPSFGVL
jgi:hypothetical protein